MIIALPTPISANVRGLNGDTKRMISPCDTFLGFLFPRSIHPYQQLVSFVAYLQYNRQGIPLNGDGSPPGHRLRTPSSPLPSPGSESETRHKFVFGTGSKSRNGDADAV